MSPSELKLLKLHSWVYHIIDSIRSFGAVNGYTTETYESLHKEYVKIPYRLSNKMTAGFSNFLHSLSLYISQLEVDISKDEIDESEVTIYGSVTLKNGDIMRAFNSFHGNPWFSNVSVRMNSDELFDYVSDQGI